MISHNWSPMKRLIWLRGSGITGGSGSWATISGNPVSFTAKAAPLRQLKVAFSPVQSLNGYDSPWPAGGGKNICPPDIEQGSFDRNGINTGPSDTTYPTRIRTQGYIPVNGGATITVSATGSAAYYTVSGYTVNDYTTPRIQSTSWIALGNSCTINADVKYIRIAFRQEDTSANITPSEIANVMCEYGTSATSYAPYSNECPISGWDSLNVEQTGVNMWDEEWELGALNSTTGQDQSDSTHIRSKNYIPIAPSTAYYNKGYTLAIFEYDANKAYLGYHNYIVGTFTTSASTRYLRFYRTATTYSNDISINYPATDTAYHAYNPSSRSISISLGETVYSGYVDVISGVGEVTMASVDMGTLQWIHWKPDGFYVFAAPITGKEHGSYNFMCSNYAVRASGGYGQLENGQTVGANANEYVYVRDDGFSDTTSFKAAVSGAQIVYPLATPIPIQLTPQEVQSLLDVNNMWSDANGNLTVEYRSN